MRDFIDFSKKIKILSGGSKQSTYIIKKHGKYFIRKSIHKNDSRKTRNQVRWFIKHKGKHVPSIIKYGKWFNKFYYDIPYFRGYVPLSEFVLKENPEKTKKIVGRLLEFLFNNFYDYHQDNYEESLKKLEEYLQSRLVNRFKEIVKINNGARHLGMQKELIINGEKYPKASELIDEILNLKEKIAEKSRKSVLNLHGDLIADNILCKEDDFILLDPDESPFNSHLVDLGKFFESFHSNYEIMLKTKKWRIKGNRIDFPEPINENYSQTFDFICKEIKKYTTKEEYALIIFNEALHYSRMLPYKHHKTPELVPIFYAQTIRLLNLFVQLFK